MSGHILHSGTRTVVILSRPYLMDIQFNLIHFNVFYTISPKCAVLHFSSCMSIPFRMNQIAFSCTTGCGSFCAYDSLCLNQCECASKGVLAHADLGEDTIQ